MAIKLPTEVDPHLALAALPTDLRSIVASLGRGGQLIACDIYNLHAIRGQGDYSIGLHDGALLAMALTSCAAALAREEITIIEHNQLHAHVLHTAKVQI